MKAQTRLILLVARYDPPTNDLAAMTLGWMAAEAGAEFDTYYAADHGHGGLFAPHGSTAIGGHHAARLARAMATFQTTVVRLGGASVFDSLFRPTAERIVDWSGDLAGLYSHIAQLLQIEPPGKTLLFDAACGIPLGVFYPDVSAARAMALPQSSGASGESVDLAGDDRALDCVRRHAANCAGIDLYEPIVASYMLAFNQRSRRLILPYGDPAEAERRRDQMLQLLAGRPQTVCHGRWFGDPQLKPLATVPTAFQVVEPHRHVLSVFSRKPSRLPQPNRSWLDVEPSDEQLSAWAAAGTVLATWVLHSGELSHDDSVLAFLDWSAMTKVCIGSGVHWQRYHFDPDVVEPMHVPAEEGGVLGIVEPVLHSAGNGILWETAGDPTAVAGLMHDSARRIASVAGERFAPRGVYCFADHHDQPADNQPGPRQIALWEAIREAGFEYVVSSALPGSSRVLYRRDGFVVLNQAGDRHAASPFVRGEPETFAAEERRLVEAGRPGWLIGAIDTPIHGCPVYIGRPYGKPDNLASRINEFYDYVQSGGRTGKVRSATPRAVARYARLVDGAAL